MLIFDTHAHYEDEAFDPDREEVLQHRLIIDEKTSHEKALQEQVDYLTKKLFAQGFDVFLTVHSISRHAGCPHRK